MSLIPDRNLFIVTSCLKPTSSAFTESARYDQTIITLENLRQKVPEAIIVFVDCSIKPLTEGEKVELGKRSNIFIDMSQEPNCKLLTDRGMKSEAENMMLFHTLMTLKHNPQISGVLNSVKRIFKYSARSCLEDSFDLKEYDGLFGKFVFKKRMRTWMGRNIPNLLITRLFSFCPSLIDVYLEVIQKNLSTISQGYDTEHAHFANIPQQYLVEFDKIHCWGWLAGNGQVESY